MPRFASTAAAAVLVLVVAATLVAPSAAALEVARAPAATATELIWESLFPPPYTACPQIVIDLACIASDLCFIPGGSNGVGFGVFTFDGTPNGNLVPMAQPNQTAMILAITMGGTKALPVGTFGGAGGGLLDMTAPLQFLANGTTWYASLIEDIEFLLETQCIVSTDDGQHVLVVGNGITGASLLHSEDGGELFEVIDANKLFPRPKNCTVPSYAVMVDAQTWYVTVGQFPQDRKDPNARDRDGNRVLRRKNVRLSVVEDKVTKQLRYSAARVAPEATEEEQRLGDYVCVGYVAIIAKTTDGGKTFTVQYQNDNANFAFSQIDCASATHCVAVGTGNTLGAQTVIFQTTDGGQTWTQVLSVPITAGTQQLLYAIEFQDAQHVWAAGSLDTQTSTAGLLYFSNDGGSTWSKYPYLQPDLYEIVDISFAGGVGYAAAMTEFKTATILKYANQPYYGYFTQAQCATSTCSFLCENITFPQGMCLTAQGGSVMAFCSPQGLEQRMYQTTSCVGSYNVTTQPVGQCLQGSGGTYFENFCDAGASSSSTRRTSIESFGRQHAYKHL